jgi:hypothetical protein
MSTVDGPSSNNPFAYLQTVRGQGQAQSSAAQGDPQSQQFAVAAPQGASAAMAAAAVPISPAPSGGKPPTAGTIFPRFEPQTLQALLALQTSGS